MMVRRLGTILFVLVLSLIGATAKAAPISNTSAENYVTVFGPNRYFSPLVGSKTHTSSFSVSPAPSAGEIIVTNGSGDDLTPESCSGLKALQKLACALRIAARTVRMNLERPASAEISLNNVVVMRPQDLPRSINRLVIPVQLKASNSIKIKLNGSPLSSIKVEVRGLDHAVPVLTLQAPSEGQIINALSTSVSGSASERLSSAKAQLNNEPEIPLSLSSDGLSFSGNISTTQNGAKVLTVTGYDLAGNPGTVSRNIVFHLNRPPTASLVLASSGSGTAPFTVLFDASSSADPDGDLLNYRFDFDDGTVITSSLPKVSHEFKDVGNYSVEVRVSDPSGDSQTASVNVVATAAELPADPTPFAPPLSQTTPQSFDETIRFLYDGPNAVQKDIAPDAIKADRVATVSGKVLDQDGQPLSGVKVSSLGKESLGYTISRAGGEFDIAINSGGITTLKFERNGYTVATRDIKTDVQSMFALDDVLLVRRDSKVTAIINNSPEAQVARGTTSTDQSGSRIATILIPPSTTATLQLQNGSTLNVDTLNIRMTEYTVGENGPKRMPAELPPQTGYTYALEISADEAIAKGADKVVFSKPVSFYVDNFLSLPAGIAMPLGYLNPKTGYWEAEPDGVVLYVLSHTNGRADLNTGSGQPATAAELAVFGIDDVELQKLSTLYQPGQSFWRVRVSHFTSFDLNGNVKKNSTTQKNKVTSNKNTQKTECSGCVIDIVSGSMSETIALPGTGTSLHYTTKRGGTRSDNATVTIDNLLGDVYPDTINSITVAWLVAGRSQAIDVRPAPNASATVTWDGLDRYGRQVYGEQEMRITIIYNQSAGYWFRAYDPLNPSTWASPAPNFNSGNDYYFRGTLHEERTVVVHYAKVRPPIDSATLWAVREVGRWTLAQHHFLDRKSGDLFMGDGDIKNIESFPKVVRHLAGVGGSPGFSGDGGPAATAQFNGLRNFTFDNDGNILIADQLNHRIRKIDARTRIVTTIAGNGSGVHSGDGGLAVDAGMISPLDVSVDRDGNIYFSDWDANRVRKIDTNGIITTVVGTGTAGYSGDGGPATAAEIHGPRSVIANPDGSLFVSEEFNHVIRRVDPSGMIKTFAGTGTEGYSGDGGPAIDADFSFPNYTATDADGNLYVGQSGFCAIRKITPGGIVTTIAGYGECGFSLDGEPATMSKVGNVAAIAIGKNGVIYFADRSNHRIRSIDAFGTLTTVIGTGQTAFNGLSRTGATTNLAFPTDVEVRPDGSLVFIEFNRNVMREFVQAPQPTAAQPGTIEIASPDGSEIFVFNEDGIHLRTLFGETRAVKFNFEYTTENRLTAVVDSSGNRTEVLRSSSGAPTAIRSPYGQLYSLQVDELDGQENLARLTYPTGESYQLRYNAFGLLTSFIKPKGGEYTFQYSDDGRLAGETDPAGGSQVIGLSFRRTREGNEVWIDHEMDRLGNSILITRSGDETYRSAVFDSGLRATNDPTLTQTNTLSTVDTRLMGLAQYEAYSDLFFAGNPSKIVQTTNRTYTSSPGAFVRTDRTTTQQGWFETVFSSSTRTYTSTTSEGRLSAAVIDAQTRPLRIQIGNLEPTLMSYDTRGRVSQITQGNRTTDFAYDTNGFLLETRNALGQVNRTQYDGSQKLISTTNPNSETTSFTYDLDRNLSSLVLPGNVLHELASTAMDLLAGYRTPSGRDLGFSYTFDNELLQVNRADGKSVRYVYQANQKRHLEQIQTEAQNISIAYKNSMPLIQNLQTSDGSTVFFQYQGHLPTAKIYSGPFSAGIGLFYDPNGRLLSSLNVAGSAINIAYNTDREPAAVGLLQIAREQQTGLVTGLQLSSVSESFGYSLYGELSSKSVSGFGGESYIRDSLGRITQRTIAAAILNETSNYTYDPSGRLSRVVRTGPFAGDIRYTYDGRGNRISVNRNGTITSATFDNDDKMLTQGNLRFTYTDHGDLLEKENIVTGQKITLTYDQRGQLTRAVLNGARTISYGIDGEGHRLTRSIDGVMETGYLHDVSGRLIAEVEPGGALRSHFVYASQGHSPDYMIRGTHLYYFAKDNLGSVKAVIDADSGAIAQAIHYDEFGRVLVNTNPGFQPFGFAGGHFDHETGLVRFGARDYDPEVGRWLSKDPILFNGGQGNLYVYVGNNPINRIDPSGLWSFTIGFYNPFTGLGGGVTFGQNPNGSVFGGVWGGGGVGGGMEFDPNGTSPGYQPGTCRGGPYVEVGGYANIGGNAGPYSAGLSSTGGVKVPIAADPAGNARGYFNPPGPYGSASNTRGIGFGGGAGAQVTIVW